MHSILGALLNFSSEKRASLDALVSEVAVQQALRAEGHHVAQFGLWALRRVARRQDVLERVLRQPKDWTWLVLAPVPPLALSPSDAELLAQVAHPLHGVSYVHWAVQDQQVTFTSWPLRTTVVRGHPILNPGPSRPEGALALPPGPLLPDLSRWASVPQERLLAALIEAAYVERMAAADQGAFTNVDVLARVGERPVVVEVKRRARAGEEATRPLTMTITQAGTLEQLRRAGCEVHVAVLVVPPGSTRQPEVAAQRGTWHAGAPVIRLGWGEMHVDLLGGMPVLSLEALRRAQALAAAPKPASPLPPPKPAPPVIQPIRSVAPPVPPRPAPPRDQTPRLKSPRRLVPFTFEYDFLRLWSPALVKLGGRLYPNAAAAYLAARTLDEGAREALMAAESPAAALRLSRHAPVRPEWRSLRDQVAWAVLRMAYRGPRGARLVQTLPFILADPEVWDESLEGLQGWRGLQVLSGVRGELATRQAQGVGECCLQCAWAQPVSWPGFVRCAHPQGVVATLGCVGAVACRGPQDAALVPVTTQAGPHFRLKQAAHRP